MSSQNITIQNIYSIQVEEPGGHYFVPQGVLLVDSLGQFTLLCPDTIHNFLRSVIQKYPFQELKKGIRHREHLVRMEGMSEQLIEKYSDSRNFLPELLEDLLTSSPRHYYFLNRYIKESERSNPFTI